MHTTPTPHTRTQCEHYYYTLECALAGRFAGRALLVKLKLKHSVQACIACAHVRTRCAYMYVCRMGSHMGAKCTLAQINNMSCQTNEN